MCAPSETQINLENKSKNGADPFTFILHDISTMHSEITKIISDNSNKTNKGAAEAFRKHFNSNIALPGGMICFCWRAQAAYREFALSLTASRTEGIYYSFTQNVTVAQLTAAKNSRNTGNVLRIILNPKNFSMPKYESPTVGLLTQQPHADASSAPMALLTQEAHVDAVPTATEPQQDKPLARLVSPVPEQELQALGRDRKKVQKTAAGTDAPSRIPPAYKGPIRGAKK
jgi:hypothetical protein